MLDRTIPPPFAHTTSFDLITPVKKQLPNGIDVFFIPGGSQEVLKIEAVLKAGRWFETVAASAYFTAQLITKGTAQKNSFDIAKQFDQYGAHIEIQPGLDFVYVSLYTLTQYLAPCLDLLNEVLTGAVFPEKELEQHKAIYIQNLKVNNEKTSFLASKAFRKKVFGEHHPYGMEPDEHQVASLKHNDLVKHFTQHYRNVSVFVSGKIDAVAEGSIADKFASWTTGSSDSPTHKANATTPGFEHIEKAGSVQSTIRAGKKSLMRHHPDYVNAVFASHVLGGYFGSRLMKNIREEKGLTYGIYASLHPLKHDSYLVIGADVNKENVGLTLDEIHKELKRLRTEKISSGELETARNHFIGSLQSEITTPFAHADKIKNIYLFGLPKDYYQQMIAKIAGITPAKLLQTAEDHFHEASLLEVAAG